MSTLNATPVIETCPCGGAWEPIEKWMGWYRCSACERIGRRIVVERRGCMIGTYKCSHSGCAEPAITGIPIWPDVQTKRAIIKAHRRALSSLRCRKHEVSKAPGERALKLSAAQKRGLITVARYAFEEAERAWRTNGFEPSWQLRAPFVWTKHPDARAAPVSKMTLNVLARNRLIVIEEGLVWTTRRGLLVALEIHGALDDAIDDGFARWLRRWTPYKKDGNV